MRSEGWAGLALISGTLSLAPALSLFGDEGARRVLPARHAVEPARAQHAVVENRAARARRLHADGGRRQRLDARLRQAQRRGREAREVRPARLALGRAVIDAVRVGARER